MESTVHFVDNEIAGQYDCGICLNKLTNPVYIGCGSHFFCNQCIVNLLSHSRSGHFPCPNCRRLCDQSQINRIEYIDRQMSQLQVRCPNWQISPNKATLLRRQKTNRTTIKMETEPSIHPLSSRSHLCNDLRSEAPSPPIFHGHAWKPIENVAGRLIESDQNSTSTSTVTVNRSRSRASMASNPDESTSSSNSRSRSRGRKKREVNELKPVESSQSTDGNDAEIDLMVTCQWVGDWSKLKQHTAECPLQLVRCKYCRKQLLRKQMESHHQKCKLFPIGCPKCGQPGIPRDRLPHHLTRDCSHAMVQCSSCNQQMKRLQFENHSKYHCPESMVHCDYRDYGCDQRMKRKDLALHIQSHMEQHLSLVMRKCSELNDNNRRLEQEQDTLRREVREQRQQLSDQGQRLHRMELRLNGMQQHYAAGSYDDRVRYDPLVGYSSAGDNNGNDGNGDNGNRNGVMNGENSGYAMTPPPLLTSPEEDEELILYESESESERSEDNVDEESFAEIEEEDDDEEIYNNEVMRGDEEQEEDPEGDRELIEITDEESGSQSPYISYE